MTAATDATPARINHRAVILAAATAALGGFLFGFDTAIVNGTVDAVKAQFHIPTSAIGFVVASALLGSAVGAWFAGPIADRIGRVKVMVGSGIIFVISALGSAYAFGAWSLVFWRVFGGLAVGAASVIAPAYIAEVAPSELRGRLGSLQQMAIVIGIFASQLVAYFLARAAGGAQNTLWGYGEAWRWMYGSAAIPALIYGALALTLPESPRYLVRRRRIPQAKAVLQKMVGGDVDGRIKDIEDTLRGGADKVRLSDLRGPFLGLLPIVWVGILLSVFQQFVGINVIFYYSATLWQSVGFSQNDSLLISTITSLTNIVGTIVAIALIDRVGRKPLLMTGAIGMVITLGILAGCFSTATGHGTDLHIGNVIGKVALVAANLYVLSFAASWGPVVWVLLGEMFNNRIRATALAVAAAAQWLANWVVSTSFPSLADFSLVFSYGLYATMALLALVFVWRAVRETKGRELESM